MRRIILTITLLLLLTTAACAESTLTERQTDWGYIVYQENDDGTWMANFRFGETTFAPLGEYVSVHDEMTQLQTFYRAEWDSRAIPAELAAYAEALMQNGEVAFVHDLGNEKLLIPGVGEVDMPGTTSAIHDAYDRAQRLFLTFTNFEGQHYLRIVTWKDELDVRDIEMPWAGYFDSFHVGNSDDVIFLCFDVPHMEEIEYGIKMYIYEVEGRWILDGLNNGWEVIDFAPWGVRIDVNGHWAYGEPPWRDMETMDWQTFPLLYKDAVNGLTNEGWLFPKADTPMHAAPDEFAQIIATCPKDMPLHVIRTEGEWAYVGMQELEDWVEQISEPPVGYIRLDELTDMPETVLPGGEVLGYFCTMQVETVPETSYYGKTRNTYVLTFATIDGCFDAMPIEVDEGFAEAARAVYREKGYAATPMGFDETLLPYLSAYVYEWEMVLDALVLENMLALAVQDAWNGTYELRLVTGTVEEPGWTSFQMPGLFRFDRTDIAAWNLAIEFTE